jgi:O-antigen/teichoic acid export membrane protein
LIAGLTGLLLIWAVYRRLPKSADGTGVVPTIKSLLGYGVPVSIGVILTAILTSFYTFVLGIYVKDNAIIGSYGLAAAFAVLITFFSTPVTTMLFPAFSKLDYRKDHETLKNVFQYSVKYAALIVVPVSAAVMALAQPGIRTIYQNGYANAPLFLALLAAPYFYTAIGNLSISNLLNGQGFTKFNMYLSIIQFVVGFPVGFVLIYYFGALGLMMSSLTVGIPSLYVGLRFIKQKFDVSVNWASSIKILLSSSIAAVATYALIMALPLVAFHVYVVPVSVPLQQLVIGLVAFVIVFILAAAVTRTIDENDLSSLREIAKSIGFLGKLLRVVLNVMEKAMAILYPSKPRAEKPPTS